jgi:hypothetical protein
MIKSEQKMALTKGKHNVKEIGGVLCTVVESGITSERVSFLKALLEFNKYEVMVEEDKSADGSEKTYTLGVTDIVFNPMIAVYELSLNRPDGGIVLPAYWNQQPEKTDLPYFEYRLRNPEAVNEDDFLPVTHNYRTV